MVSNLYFIVSSFIQWSFDMIVGNGAAEGAAGIWATEDPNLCLCFFLNN